MLIPLKCQCEAAACTEWAIVELQGSLVIHDQAQVQDLNIGKLCRKGVDKFVVTIGYHELDGSRIALKKPLLVLRNAALPKDGGSHSEAGHPPVEVVGIIRHKILFKSRPKPIITKPPVRGGKKARPSPADASVDAAEGSTRVAGTVPPGI